MKKLLLLSAIILIAVSAYAEWSVIDETDPITDEQKLAFVYTGSGFLEPALVVRVFCETLDVYINWREYFSDNETNRVIVRFDKEDPLLLPVSISTDNVATFFYSAEMIKNKLLISDVVVFRATPWEESPITFVVSCAEFRELYAPYAGRLDK